MIESGRRLLPRTRGDSWYDDELETREGEDILARYDSWAIRELSRLQLIWKSWGLATSFVESIVAKEGMPSFGLRKVSCENASMLRLFFLSLLWRAAATKRAEFQDVQIVSDDLERLRRMVREGDPNPLDFYPTTLLQIASRGPMHNLVPIEMDSMVDIGDGVMRRVHVFRFYFDGLIARMHPSMTAIKEIEPFIVGGGPELVVQMQLFEDSFQFGNLQRLVLESVLQWPQASARITGNTK